jgi:hypothetical protein
MNPDCCGLPAPPAMLDARQSLNASAEEVGGRICQNYGPCLGWTQLLRLLQDRSCVRYPCEIVFDATPLGEGEFAHPVPKGERPEEGFCLHVHPFYRTQLDQVPVLVLYQLVLVNYGAFAGPQDAEALGAAALGITRDAYYDRVCRLADELERASLAA